MNNLEAKIKKLNKLDIIGIIILLLAFSCEIFIIFKGTHYFFHSDDSTVITLALEQWKQKKIYPTDWCYGTGIWNFELNVLVLPFLKICKHWLHARAAAVVLQTAIMLFLMWGFKRSEILGKYFWVSPLMLLLPISEVITEHCYFQATYMTGIVYLMALILLTLCLMKKGKVKCLVASICMLLILITRMETGFIYLLVFIAPMLATLVFFAIYKSHYEKISLRGYYLAGGVIIAGTVIGYIRYNSLIGTLNMTRSAVGGYAFIPSIDMGNSLLNLWNCLLRLFGAADKSQELLTLGGINKAIAVVYLIIMLLIVPICIGKNFSRLRTDNQKIFFMFSVISALANIYIFLFTGMSTSRYLIWIYFYAIINLGILIDNIETFDFAFEKEYKIGFALFFIVINLGCYTYYLTYNYDENPDILGVNDEYRTYKLDYDLLDYMEKKGYTCGYSYYWASYSYMAASDGRIHMGALVEKDWSRPYYWLNSKRWYDMEDENGECFLLVPNSKMKYIPQEYVKKADRKDEYHDHTIYIYKGVNVLKEIWEKNGYVE